MYNLTTTFIAFFKIAAVLAVVTVLQGCAISHLTSGFGSGIFGKKSAKGENRNYISSVSQQNLLAAAKSDIGQGGDVHLNATGCPQFSAWPNNRHLTIYEPGKSGDGLSIIYRGEITKTARECKISPGLVGVKYGFAGRVLLGPKGKSGTVKLPILVYVTDRDRNKIHTDRLTVNVEVSKDNPIGYFSTVKVVKFPIQAGVRPLDYKIFVAFEQPATL